MKCVLLLPSLRVHFKFVREDFAPDESGNLTREQLAGIIVEILGLKQEAVDDFAKEEIKALVIKICGLKSFEKNLSPLFEDNEQISNSAKPFVMYCRKKNLLPDWNGSFLPQSIVTGKELGSIILKVLGYGDVSPDEVTAKLKELEIPEIPRELTRKEAFNYIWKAFTLPITPEGKALAVKLGKVKPEDIVLVFQEGGYYRLAMVRKGGKYRYIDKMGSLIVPPAFDDAYHFSKEGLAAVQTNGNWGFIDKSGTFIIQPTLDWTYGFTKEGLASVRKNGKWGYIDQSGSLVIEPVFDHAYEFSGGLAAVLTNRKWGYIDKTGNFVIKPLFDKAYNFNKREGIAPIRKNGRWGYIDKTGNSIVEPTLLTNKIKSCIMNSGIPPFILIWRQLWITINSIRMK